MRWVSLAIAITVLVAIIYAVDGVLKEVGRHMNRRGKK